MMEEAERVAKEEADRLAEEMERLAAEAEKAAKVAEENKQNVIPVNTNDFTHFATKDGYIVFQTRPAIQYRQ